MNITRLTQAVLFSSQEELAKSLGVTQGAIWQAVQQKRNIFVLKNKKGISAFEIKPVFRKNPNIDVVEKLITKNPSVHETSNIT